MGIGPERGGAPGAAQGEPKLRDCLSECFRAVTCTALWVRCASPHRVVLVEVARPEHTWWWGRQSSDPTTYCIQREVGVRRIIDVEYGNWHSVIIGVEQHSCDKTRLKRDLTEALGASVCIEQDYRARCVCIVRVARRVYDVPRR